MGDSFIGESFLLPGAWNAHVGVDDADFWMSDLRSIPKPIDRVTIWLGKIYQSDTISEARHAAHRYHSE